MPDYYYIFSIFYEHCDFILVSFIRCIPNWLSKKMFEQSAKYEDVSPDDASWVQFK